MSFNPLPKGDVLTTDNQYNLRVIEANSIFGMSAGEGIYKNIIYLCGDLGRLIINNAYPIKKTGEENESFSPYLLTLQEYGNNLITMNLKSYRALGDKNVLGTEWGIAAFPQLELAEVYSYEDRFSSNEISVKFSSRYGDDYTPGLPQLSMFIQEMRNNFNCNLCDELTAIKRLDFRLC